MVVEGMHQFIVTCISWKWYNQGGEGGEFEGVRGGGEGIIIMAYSLGFFLAHKLTCGKRENVS